MSRARNKLVRTTAIRSRKLASISSDAERLYWRIYMASDNYGTMVGDPWDVLQEAAPGVTSLSERQVAAALDELVSIGLLVRWMEDDGKLWVHVEGHDSIQSAEFLRKRGKRRTPEVRRPKQHLGRRNDGLGRNTPAQHYAGQNEVYAGPNGVYAGPNQHYAGQNEVSLPSKTKSQSNQLVSHLNQSGYEGGQTDVEIEIVPTPPNRISTEAFIRDAKRKLGNISFLVEEFVARGRKPNGEQMSLTDQWSKCWQPVLVMHELYDSMSIDHALRTALSRNAGSVNYAAGILANQQNTRTSPAVVESGPDYSEYNSPDTIVFDNTEEVEAV